jgi:hypothetical protein
VSTSDIVARRFAEYLDRSQPADNVLATAIERTKDIQAALLRSVDIAHAARVGSFYKGSAVRAASDLDLFVVLRRDDVRRAGRYVASTTVLDHLRSAISDRYPRSVVGRDRSAVVVSFNTGIPIDVVPAVFVGPLQSGHPLYQIPHGGGGWLETSPDAQRTAFAVADRRSGSKLRRSIQLIKTWARYRQAPLPISSYYLESALAAAQVANGPRPYSLIMADSFRVLAKRGATALQDPLGISGYILPARTEAQRNSLCGSLGFAYQHSSAAYDAECAGDSREGIRQWRVILPGLRA